MNNEIGVVLIAVLAVIVVFLLIREIVCWYWKINRIVLLLESIEQKLGGKTSS
ncbi:MAG: hypothetical protein PHE55_04685 [Methylococcaceae bacterium]|nr:hypothetical protein [Methylococcaceae bacterium]